MPFGEVETPKRKTKFVLVPLDSVTKTISKFTTPDYQRKIANDDLNSVTKTISKFTTPDYQRKIANDEYSQWDVWPEEPEVSASQSQSQNRRPHSSSEGSITDHKLWKSEPRKWVSKDRSNSLESHEGWTARKSVERVNRRRNNAVLDSEFLRSQKKLLAQQAQHEQKDLLARFATGDSQTPAPASRQFLADDEAETPTKVLFPSEPVVKTCLAPFNPEGGKLKDYAAYLFSQAYGLGEHSSRPHEEVIRDAQTLTSCSMRAIKEILYGFSYDEELGHLRAQVPAYPEKVPNKERNLELNRDRLLAAEAVAQPRKQEAAVESPRWNKAKRIASVAMPAALLLSPFIF